MSSLIMTIIKRYTNLRPEEDIAIWYVQVCAELAAAVTALLFQFLLVGHGCPSDVIGMLNIIIIIINNNIIIIFG